MEDTRPNEARRAEERDRRLPEQALEAQPWEHPAALTLWLMPRRTRPDMEIDDERQMVGGVASQREWTMWAWRTSNGPRTKALSSETTGQYAGNERNRERGAVTCAKP